MSLNESKIQALDKIFYQENNYVGRDKLWYLARKKYPRLNITQNDAMEYLKGSETYQLFHQIRNRKTIQPTIVKQPYNVVAIDLIDMNTWESKKMKWILTLWIYSPKKVG